MKKYIILFGTQIYHPEHHYKTKYRYEKLKDARAVARCYCNSHVFRIYDDGTCQELKKL